MVNLMQERTPPHSSCFRSHNSTPPLLTPMISPLTLHPAPRQAPAYNDYQRRLQANVNLNQPVAQFKDKVLAWERRADGMNVDVRHVKQADLPPAVFPDGAPAVVNSRERTTSRKAKEARFDYWSGASQVLDVKGAAWRDFGSRRRLWE